MLWILFTELNSIGNKTLESIKKADDRQDLEMGVGSFLVSVDGYKDTPRDVYNRERLPKIAEVLASSDSEAIDKMLRESQEDPFIIKPLSTSYSKLLFGDQYFDMLTRLIYYAIIPSFIISSCVPLLKIGYTIISKVVVWATEFFL